MSILLVEVVELDIVEVDNEAGVEVVDAELVASVSVEKFKKS